MPGDEVNTGHNYDDDSSYSMNHHQRLLPCTPMAVVEMMQRAGPIEEHIY